MAITDEQLDNLCDYAEQLGYDGVLNDPTDDTILGAVFDFAELENMRTEDEFDRLITIDDIPDEADIARIIEAYNSGDMRADNEVFTAMGKRAHEGG